MLTVRCRNEVSRSIASTSAVRLAGLHTSSTQLAQKQRKFMSNRERKQLKEYKAKALEARRANAPHVVLGTTPLGELTHWPKSDLANTIVTAEDLRTREFIPEADSNHKSIRIPKEFNYGLTEEHKDVLFGSLPSLSVKRKGESLNDPDWKEHSLQSLESAEVAIANNFAKAIDLRNANARAIRYVNTRKIVEKFAPKPDDTGRPEVQAAILTMRIRNLYSHLENAAHDHSSGRRLTEMVHKRAKILRYLKKKDPVRYWDILPRLSITRSNVEGEQIVGRVKEFTQPREVVVD